MTVRPAGDLVPEPSAAAIALPAAARGPADVLDSAATRAIIDGFPFGAVVVFDDDLRFLEAGGTGVADMPFSREMLLGSTIFQVYPPGLVAMIEPLYQRALAGAEGTMDVSFRGRTFEHRAGPLRTSDGSIIGGICFAQEVTGAHRAERELRDSELRFRLAFDDSPIASGLIGMDGRYLQVNQAFCDSLGYSREQALRMTTADFIHPAHLAADSAAMARLIAGEVTTYTVENRYLTITGDVLWGAKTVTVMSADDGSPAHYLIQIQDITDVKHHEHALLEARRRLRGAESIGQVGSWETDLRTGTITWSTGLLELYGIDPASFDGDYPAAMHCIHPDDRAEVTAAVAAAKAGRLGHVRYRVTRWNDGALRWIEGRGRALYENGRPIRVIGAVADITDQVMAEAEAAAAQSFQDAVFDASPDIISVWDFASRSITFTNHSITTLLGYTDEEVRRAGGVGEFVHPGDRGRVVAALAAAQGATDDSVIRVDYRMLPRNGALRWFSQRTAPLSRDENGRVTRIAGVIRDTTSAMAAEAALRESTTLFDQLAGSINAVFLLRSWDPPKFLYVSPGYERILGYNPMTTAETPEQSLQRIHPDDVDRFRNDYWTPSEAGIAAVVEYRIISTDGGVRWVRAKSTPVAHPDRRFRRSAIIVQDITVNRQAEFALRSARDAQKAAAAKNEFLSRMSHELRTPLGAILGFAQLLELDPLTEEQVTAIRYILRGGRHLLALIDDVLDISKIDGDRLELFPETVLVSRLLIEAIDATTPQADAAGITLSLARSADADRSVVVDIRRFSQVVRNLLSNAVKYNRPGGRVDISARVDDDARLSILVADTGRGIRTQDLPRLFTPFERLGAQTDGIDGTGIGLALSHRLMTLIGGSLTVSSEVGSGSTFTATLPLPAAAVVYPP